RPARNLAGAGEKVVMADAGRMHAHQDIVRPRLRLLDLDDVKNLRPAEAGKARPASAPCPLMPAPQTPPRLACNRHDPRPRRALPRSANVPRRSGAARAWRGAWSPARPPENSRR